MAFSSLVMGFAYNIVLHSGSFTGHDRWVIVWPPKKLPLMNRAEGN